MKAVLTNFGTTGDVLPLLALGEALRRRGHDVVMAFAPSHREAVARHRLPFVPVGPDVRDVQDEINRQWIADESTYTSPERAAQVLAPLAQSLPQTYAELCDATRMADVLVSGPAQPAARMVHETTAIPFVSVQFSNFGGSGAPGMSAATAAFVNPFRKKLRLGALANPVTTDANSPQLALYAMSRHLVSRGSVWPPHYRIVGFFVPQADAWVPDPALREFFDAGPPPVVVSFGSMPHDDPERLARTVADAAARAGVRVVCQVRRLDAPPTATVHVTGFVPHGWLFERASCIVHHGGAGTAAAAFRAGRPSIYVPHGAIFDQYYWAQLSRDRGCSGEPIPIDDLEPGRLAAAIREALDEPERGVAASQLGALVRAEDGIGTACRAMEDLVARVGLGDDLDGEVLPASPSCCRSTGHVVWNR